jgi:hypothetical protein
MYFLKKFIIFYVLVIFFLGCTSGYYTQKKSTAPFLGPILVGLSRAEVENYMGMPLSSYPTGKGTYTNLYEYHRVWTSVEIRNMDILDFFTFGMGEWIISPMERYEGPKILVSITYAIEGTSNYFDDRVVFIDENQKGSKFKMQNCEKQIEAAGK